MGAITIRELKAETLTAKGIRIRIRRGISPGPKTMEVKREPKVDLYPFLKGIAISAKVKDTLQKTALKVRTK